jgi:hypothetical protein
LCYPVISSAYGVSRERRMLWNFVWSWNQWYALIITTASSITLFVNMYNSCLFPLVRQFFFFRINLISLWIPDRSFPLLLESVLLESNQHLQVFTFSSSWQQPEPQRHWALTQTARLYAFQSAKHHPPHVRTTTDIVLPPIQNFMRICK